jgi:hypothetical protein
MDAYIDIEGPAKTDYIWRFYYEYDLLPGEVIIHALWGNDKNNSRSDFRTTAEELITVVAALKVNAVNDRMSLKNLRVSFNGRMDNPKLVLDMSVEKPRYPDDATNTAVYLYAVQGFVDFLIKTKYAGMLADGASETVLAAVGLATIMRHADITA